MPADTPERLYAIQNDTYNFHTGLLPDGRQVLMGVYFPDLVVVEFGYDGTYLSLRTETIPPDFVSVNSHGIKVMDEVRLDEEIRKLQQAIGYSPATIRVKQFFLSDRRIGIRDLPDYLVEAAAGMDADALDPAEAQEDIRIWQENGEFVLWWSKDIYMDAEGGITST